MWRDGRGTEQHCVLQLVIPDESVALGMFSVVNVATFPQNAYNKNEINCS